MSILKVRDKDGKFVDVPVISGRPASIKVGEVKLLEPNSEPTIENVGTEYDAIFNFGIPKGEYIVQGENFKLDLSDYVKQKQLDREIQNRQQTDNNLQSQIKSLASGSPLVASSISEMTDKKRVYVNTTDGNWYYYNGTSWVDGGVYQATEIADNSISHIKLSTKLQDNYVGNYEEVDVPTTDGTYFTIGSDGTVYELSYENWVGGTIDLVAGGIYYITGRTFSTDVKTYIIKENNVVVNSSPQIASGEGFNSVVYEAKANTKLHVCGRKDKYNDYIVYKLTDVNINSQKIDTNLKPFAIRNSVYPDVSNRSVGQKLDYLSPSTSYNTEIYRIEKGKKYEFSARGYYVISGLVITDLEYTLLYICPRNNESLLTTDVFEANYDGYAFICNQVGETKVTGEISLFESLNKIKNWYVIGDSITEKNFRALKNYHDYIKEDLDINVINLGHSGKGYMKGKDDSTPANFVSKISRITNYNVDTDIITVMGSINDFDLMIDNLGKEGDTTQDTIYGCMYNFFNTLFTKYPGVRIGIISLTPTEYYRGGWFEVYYNALLYTAKYFSIPILNLTFESNLRPWETTFKEIYFKSDGIGSNNEVDGTHPNSKGHKLISNKIKEFIKAL